MCENLICSAVYIVFSNERDEYKPKLKLAFEQRHREDSWREVMLQLPAHLW